MNLSGGKSEPIKKISQKEGGGGGWGGENLVGRLDMLHPC